MKLVTYVMELIHVQAGGGVHAEPPGGGVHAEPPAYAWVLYTVTSSLGQLTNTVALSLFIYNRNLLRGTMNILILNQVVLDFIMSLCILIYTLQTKPIDLSSNQVNNMYCILWLSKLQPWLFFCNSTYNVVAITFDRYVAICHPIWYRTRYAPWMLFLVIIAVWSTGPVFEGTHYAFTSYVENGTCYYFRYNSRFASVSTGVIYFLFTYVCPFGAILLGHIWILKTLKQRRRLHLNDEGLNSVYRNMFVTVALISTIILCCCTEEQIYYLLFNLQTFHITVDTWRYHIFINLVFLNIFLNPIIFVFKYREFRSVFLEFCHSFNRLTTCYTDES